MLNKGIKNKYDVALSFAGEQREYVEQVAKYLEQYGKNVFYDDFERADLWGKNLYDHLYNVYSEESEYIIMFISKEYKNKEWTRHERKASQEKAFIQSEEYILPVRFDDTKIPGLNNTIGHLDANKFSPEEIAQIFTQKTGAKLAGSGDSTPVNEESKDYPIKYKNIVYLWHTASNERIDTDLIERRQIQVIVDADNYLALDNIEKVTYHLHPTFPNNKRDVIDKSNNFLFKFKAWGSFQLKAEVYFKGYKMPLVLFRYINLHTF